VECADVLAWAPEQTARYDLIVSNPPYLSPALSAVRRSVNRRAIPVRSIKALLTSAAELISEEGFSAWSCQKIPVIRLLKLRRRSAGTYVCVPIFRIQKGAAAPRAAGTLAKRGECFNDRMVIRGPDQRYSEDYTALTQAFYLFM
jgi:tRNA1Val (adenine37-N6)-methyltransferase